jgi:hypothetical protein
MRPYLSNESVILGHAGAGMDLYNAPKAVPLF